MNWNKRALAALLGTTLAAGSVQAETELTLMMFGGPTDVAIWDKLSAKFEADNPGVKVKVEISDWDSFWEKLRVLVGGGTAPDVFAMSPPNYPDWQSRGALYNIDKFVERDSAFFEDVYPLTMAPYKTSEGYFGVPRDFQTSVLYFNKDMFDAAGVEYPTEDWTWDDLRTAAKKLTIDKDGDGSIDQWGFSPDLTHMEVFWAPLLRSHGAQIVDLENGKTLIGSDQAMEAWRFVEAMAIEDKSIPSETQVAEYGYDPFYANVAAMTAWGHWVVPDYADVKLNFDVVPLPKGPKGRVTSVNSAGYVMSASTKHPEEAWELMKFAVGPEAQNELTAVGFAIPIQKSIANGPVFLEQDTAEIDHQLFIDALDYAQTVPSFRGYEEWASTVGGLLSMAWSGEMPLDEAVAEAVEAGDDIMAENR